MEDVKEWINKVTLKNCYIKGLFKMQVYLLQN